MRRLNFLVMILLTAQLFDSGSALSAAPVFIDMGDGTVVDTVSHTRWLKNANCFEKKDWFTAYYSSVGNLASPQCGLRDGSVAGDWSLPTLMQLKSVYTDAGSYAALSQFFGNVMQDMYWASTPDSTWKDFVNMKDGTSGVGYNNNNFYVWPINNESLNSFIVLSSSGRDFGFVDVYTTTPSRTFTINNNATFDLVVTDISFTDGDTSMFALDRGDGTGGTCGTASKTLPPGSGCTISVSFTPAVYYRKIYAMLHIASNDPLSPSLDVKLGGTGVSPPVSWWKAENNATDSAGNNHGTLLATSIVLENGTATASCSKGTTITASTTLYGANSSWIGCGSCTTGVASCSIAFNNGTCGGDPTPNIAKLGRLDVTCGGSFPSGMIGQAFSFDGSTAQYVAIPHSSSLNLTTKSLTTGHSVAFWVKLNTLPAPGNHFQLVSKWADGVEHKQINILPNGTVSYFLFGPNVTVTSATTLQTGVWNHVAATYDGEEMNIYINGGRDAHATASGNVADGTGRLFLGYNPDTAFAGGEEPFNGLLDEVLWYNLPLLNGQISLLSTTDRRLTVTTSGTGSGMVTTNVTPGILSWSGATGTANYPANTSVTLTATPENGSSFSGWSVECTGSVPCTLIMTGPHIATATFTMNDSIRIGMATKPYGTVNLAYAVAQDGDIIKALGINFTGDATLNRPVAVTLQGGYDSGFGSRSGNTTLDGNLSIGSGSVIIDGFVMK
ncbi:MAG: DUF1566 domain-containing protein [Desulfuromonadales bacterium]|nr:DUF1566 domain-containing protein [Desulfuromonadales bacterium]